MTLYEHAKKLYNEQANKRNIQFGYLPAHCKAEWCEKAYDELKKMQPWGIDSPVERGYPTALYEHAKKIYRAEMPSESTQFQDIGDASRLKWFGKAHTELVAERDKLQSELANLQAVHSSLQVAYSLLRSGAITTTQTSPDPKIDQMKRERSDARSALNRIHTAFSMGACGLFDPSAIADRAVKFIKEHLDKPASDPSIDWSTVLKLAAALKYPDNNAISVNGVLRDAWSALSTKHDFMPKLDGTLSAEALRELNKWGLSAGDFKVSTQPESAKYEWRGTSRRDAQILYRTGPGVGEVYPTFKGISNYDWNVTLGLNPAIQGTAHSLLLAKSAVEAVVRAHFGDKA